MESFFKSASFRTILVGSLILIASGSLFACLPIDERTPIPSLTPAPPTATVSPATPSPTIFASSPTPDGCTEKTGRINQGVIETALLDKPMRFNVYLPPCYAKETEKRYPVLYLLHGQNFDENQWIRIGAASTADQLIAAGQIPPFIIVMPFDYSYKQPTEYGFEDVFINILLPKIDGTYRTNPIAAQRAVGGLSRGGAWAIHLGIRHPDLFGAIGAHSPAIFYSDVDTLPVRLRDADKDHFPPIFIDLGDHDSEYETALQFENLLNQMNIPHEWHEYQGFHEEKYWSAHVEEYLRWYTRGWQ